MYILTDRTRYTLNYQNNQFVVNEPLGWKDDGKSFTRNPDYHGIFVELSNNITFIDSGANYIKNVYENYGINAEIKLKKEIRHPQTDKWVLDYDGVLDLSEYIYEDGKVTVKFNSSGLLSLIKARQNEKVEIERLTTMDGIALPELETKTLFLDGRNIYLVSILKNNVDHYFVDETFDFGGQSGDDYTFTNEVVADSDDNLFPVIELNTSPFGVSNTFYKNIEENPVDILYKIILKYQLILTPLIQDDSVKVYIGLYKYIEGESIELVNEFYNETIEMGVGDMIFNVDIDSEISINVLPNQYLRLVTSIRKSPNELGGKVKMNDVIEKFEVTVSRNSYFEPSFTKTVLAKELGERLTKIIGGDEFKSNLLGRTDIGYQSNGSASMTALTHGHWVRRFETSPLYKKFTTSLKDFLESMNVLHSIGITIEKKGAKEVLRLESKDYFYQKFTAIKLGKVAEIKRYPAKEFFYSGIEIGYEKPNDSQLYEEAMGLDEYNTKTTLTTVISRIQSTLSLISKYRGDSYGKEFARRKPIATHPTDDTRFDSDIFVSDVEWNGTNLRESKWSDDLDSLPTGVFSPETATNLMFTPMRLLLKHGKYIKAGLTKYYNDYTRYSSSLGNSNLTTVKDSVYLSESQNILNKDLGRAVYTAEWIEFKKDVTQTIKEQIKGSTAGVPNVYGLIEFENENGQLEKGYLFEYKQNEGEFKILKNGV
jgi:hypothetical protein